MYRNKKKMIIVGTTSVGILTVFGVSAWAIINQSYKTSLDSAVAAKLSGNTIFLSNGQFQYGKMSFNDWLIYNYVTKIDLTTSGDVSTYKFSSPIANSGTNSGGSTGSGGSSSSTTTQYLTVATLTYNKSTKTYNLKTGVNQDFDLLTSQVKQDSNSFTISNSYSWSTDSDETFNFTRGSDGYTYSTDSYKISYSSSSATKKDSSTSQDDSSTTTGSTTYTTAITSNTNVTVWSRKMEVPKDTNNGTIKVTYNTSGLGTSSLIVTYVPTPTNTEGVVTYTVSYASNNSATTGASNNNTPLGSQNNLLTFLGVMSGTNSSVDFSKTKLSSQNYFLYLPDITI